MKTYFLYVLGLLAFIFIAMLIASIKKKITNEKKVPFVEENDIEKNNDTNNIYTEEDPPPYTEIVK